MASPFDAAAGVFVTGPGLATVVRPAGASVQNPASGLLVLPVDAARDAARQEPTMTGQAYQAVPEIPDIPVGPRARMSAEEQDRLILNYAILNGALELLPDSLASVAIIPLQMKLVYRIGQSYGYELGREHIKEFLVTAGIGMTSQYVERIGSRFVGRLFGRGLIGRLLGMAARQAVSSGFSFATTYAIGRLAVTYYAGGRTFSAQVLKDTYASLFGQAKAMQGQYASVIREKARTVNVSDVLRDVTA